MDWVVKEVLSEWFTSETYRKRSSQTQSRGRDIEAKLK